MTRPAAIAILSVALTAAVMLAVPPAERAAGQSAPHPRPQIWFIPMDPVERPGIGRGAADYMRLFEPDAPWTKAASYIQVFGVYPQLMRSGSDSDLSTIFGWLKAHGIALAVETGLIQPRTSCRRTEGFDDDQSAMAQRIQRLGGDLRYVVADEPVYFGHDNDEPDACHIPIAELARDAAASARSFQSIFPRIQILDGEPISNFKEADWPDHIGQFLTAFRDAYGQPIAAVHLDIDWERPWHERALAIASYLQRVGTPIGVIYNGNPSAKTDAEWLASAREHFRAYEALVGTPPNQAILQSWMPRPTQLLPEGSASAFAGLIIDYADFHQASRPR